MERRWAGRPRNKFEMRRKDLLLLLLQFGSRKQIVVYQILI